MPDKGQSSLMSNYCYEKSRKDSYLKLNKSRLIGTGKVVLIIFAHKNWVMIR